MRQPAQIVPRSPRAKLAQRVRIRLDDSSGTEEICVTQNVSRHGFYFETSLEHYLAGMYVYLTRNFDPDDLANREESGEVLRVEELENGKWGVAIRVQASVVQPASRWREEGRPLPGSLPVPSRSFKPERTTAVAKYFDTLQDTELAATKRKFSGNGMVSPIGELDRRRTRRALVQIPLLVYCHTPVDGPFSEQSVAIEINAHGAVIAMKTAVPPGERLLLTNETNQKTQECTVLSVASTPRAESEVTVAFGTAAPMFWCK